MKGYYGRPVLKEPVWIWAVPAYFYAGGAAGAALVLGAVAQLAGRDELRDLVRNCRRLGALGTAGGGILLIYDLGRPERFLNMLRLFRPTSAMSIGSWTLAVAGASSAAAAVLPGIAGNTAGLVAGAAGLPLAGYTAVLLADTAVPLWQSSRKVLP
ncbi:MAG: NrfD/PsrC family molybdoenzyme membrane anchor subunit, partial [Actinomycetota bacterium]